jgi:hypothetical protein
MTRFPTTPTGEVRKVGKWAPNNHPHHTRLRGVGVWCGGKKPESEIRENRSSGGGNGGCQSPKVQAICRWRIPA